MREVWRKREEERLRKETEDIQTNYPFKPKVFEHEHQDRLNKIHNEMPTDIGERLLNEQKNKQLEREIKKKQLEDEQNKQLNFAPEIGFNSKVLAEKRRLETRGDNKPIYDQLINEKRNKETKMRKLQNEEEEIARHQFKPEINEISAWIAKNKQVETNVYQRLSKKNEKELQKEDDAE